MAQAANEDNLFNNSQRIAATQLVEAVLARNPNLPATQAAWEVSRARIEQISALDDPTLTYAVAPRTAGATGLDVGQRLEISQRIPWPGKRRLRGEAAEHEADAAQEDIESLRLKLVAMAKSTFADWYFIHEAIRINRTNMDLLQEFRRIAEIKYSSGSASKQDALHASVEFNMLEHRAIILDGERREVLVRINTLLNRVPDQAVPPPARLPSPGDLPDTVTLREMALDSRPELKALTSHLQSLRAKTGLAKREFYPDFKIMAGYNSLWSQKEKRFTVGIGINIPFGQSKRRAGEEEAQARMRQAKWELADKISVITGEVQLAYERVEESRHVTVLYRKRLLPLAEENLNATRSDYQTGSGNFLNLISAEKNLMQTRLQLELALSDYYRHLAMLEHAVGGPQIWQSMNVGRVGS
ncbi:MAG: TolC family protein [Mariprofundaceae bacterium]